MTEEIEIEVQIGPCTFNVEFQVMDISPFYNCLLGRPWIHIAGAVPSTLHQKIKFVIEGQLVYVSAEEDMIAAISSRGTICGDRWNVHSSLWNLSMLCT